MKRIALLRANPKSSGLGRLLKFLENEYAVDCYIWDRQGDYTPPIQNPNIRYIRCGIRSDFYSVTTLVKLFFFQCWLLFKLLFAKVDCIHAIDLTTGIIGLAAARLKGIRLVYHCFDPYYATLPASWPRLLGHFARWLEDRVISWADMFIITDLLRLPQHPGAHPKKVIEIANIPLLDRPTTPYRKRAEMTTGFLGSLTSGRDLFSIINTIGRLQDDGFRCTIGGFGPLEDAVRSAAQHYSNITFTPWIPYAQVLEMEQDFDLFLVLLDKNHRGYRWGSSNKLFEAMYFGRPIIVCEGTLMAKRVAMIGNGLIIPYGSEQELEKALRYLQNNPEVLAEMGKKGQEEFTIHWNQGTMRDRLLQAYSTLLN